MKWQVWEGEDNYRSNHVDSTKSNIVEKLKLTTTDYNEAIATYDKSREHCRILAEAERKYYRFFCYIIEFNSGGAFTIKHANYFSEKYRKENPIWCPRLKCNKCCNGNCGECYEI